MNETDLAYIAGIIDGEGSINIIHSSPRRRHINGEIYAQVGVTNTNEWLIRYLQSNFGGGVNLEKAGRNPLSKKDCWRWNLSHKKATDFLILIVPYLHIKKQQAELALLHQSQKKHNTMTAEARVMQEANHVLMQSLNARS